MATSMSDAMAILEKDMRVNTVQRVIEAAVLRPVTVAPAPHGAPCLRFTVDWGFLPAEAGEPLKRVSGFVQMTAHAIETSSDLEALARVEADVLLDSMREVLFKQLTGAAE